MELCMILETFKLRTNILLLKHIIVSDPPKSTDQNKLMKTTPSENQVPAEVKELHVFSNIRTLQCKQSLQFITHSQAKQ